MAVTATPRPASAPPPGPAPAAARRPRRGPVRGRALLLGLALAALAAAGRFVNLESAYELFIDEVTYTVIGANVAAGAGVSLYGEGFHLHPPGFLWLIGGVIELFDTPSSLLELPLDLRAVTAGFGVVMTVLVLALVTRAAGWLAGAIAGLLVATDPFVIRFDSRVMLEAPAMTWVVAGYVALLPALARRDRRLAALAGFLFGLALITKEPTAFLTVLPLLALAAGRLVGTRTIPLTAFAACCAVWLVPLLVLVFSGDFGEWFDEKGSGVLRLVGAVQETGFNQPGAQPFTAKLVDNLVLFGGTYALFATGGFSALWLAWRWWRGRGTGPQHDGGLVVALWQLSASALLVYAMGFGTLEEQMFYLLAIPSIATSAIAASVALRSARVVRVALPALALLAVLAFNGQVWATKHVHETDDAYAQFVRWAEPRLPSGTTFAATEDTMQFVLRDLDLGTWATPAELGREDVEYVLVATRLADEGYGTGTPELIAFLESVRAPVVFRARGRTLGELRLYDVSHYTGGGPSAS